MTWRAYLIETVSGRVGRRLQLAGGSWSVPLNGIPEATVKVSKSDLRAVTDEARAPWRGGLLLTFESAFWPETPIVAGPIVAPPVQSRDHCELTARGIEAMLQRRFLLAREYGHDAVTYADDMRWLPLSKIPLTGMSLGTIAQEVIYYATDRKTAGALPIVFGSPREVGAGLHDRTYEGFNLANNEAWKRLTELTEVEDGPDLAFRPRWAAEDRSRIEWAFVHGSSAQPTIGQAWTMSVDTTAPVGPVGDVSVTATGENLTSRAYWTGAGEGGGTLVEVAEDRGRIGGGMPLLESVGSDPDTENRALLRSKAAGAVRAGAAPLYQVTTDVDGSDRRTQLGRFAVGDASEVTLSGWLDIDDGERSLRLIAAKGDLSSPRVTLEFQPDPL
jgi:hypothetical protein